MANQTSTLNSQPTEAKKHPSPILGAIPGGFETLWDSIVGGPSAPMSEPRIVDEGPVSAKDFEQVRQWPELVRGVSTDGSLTGFQTPRKREDLFPQERIHLDRELYRAHLETIMNLPNKQKRERINQLNQLQLNYQGSMDREGNVYEYHKVNAEKKDAELLAVRIQQDRAEKLVRERAGKQTSPKGAIGPTVNLNTDFEDRNLSGKPG